MRKRLPLIGIATVFVALVVAAAAFAGPGLLPDTPGPGFGADVADQAVTDTEGLVDDVTGGVVTGAAEFGAPADAGTANADMAGGLPAAHNMTGWEFGEYISGVATTNPAALVEHMLGMVGADAAQTDVLGGLPEAGGDPGPELGPAVAEKAVAEPSSFVDEVTGEIPGR